jgi:hypothetical protein
MKHSHKKISTLNDVKKHEPSKEERPLFIFVYMIGCPYCDMMMPEWRRMESIDFVDTMMVNHQLLEAMKKKDPSFAHIYPNGYPHLELMPSASTNHGIPYNGERDTIHFIEFVESRSDKKPKVSDEDTKAKKSSKKDSKVKAKKSASRK